MDKLTADRQFIETYYGGDDAFCKAVKNDYCFAQFNWSCYIDSLCKAGEITQHQYDARAFQGNKYRR